MTQQQKVCFVCGRAYETRHASKEAAFATEDMESREQWITGTCSTQCWDWVCRDAEDDEGTEDVPS